MAALATPAKYSAAAAQGKYTSAKTFKPNVSPNGFENLSSSDSNINLRDTKTGIYYYIRPVELSLDIMQYFVNNRHLHKITKKYYFTTKTYLSITDSPSIQIETSKESRESNNIFHDVYEDEHTPLLPEQVLIENYENGKYINNVNMSKDDKPTTTFQNIQYVKDIIDSLESSSGTKTCDLKDIDPNYIFNEDIICKDGITYKIVGYTSSRIMRQYLDLWKEDKENSLQNIHAQYKTNYIEDLKNLYNSIKPDDKITNDNEIYKLMLGGRSFYYDNTLISYKNLITTDTKPGKITQDEYTKFETNFKEQYEKHYNQIAKRYLIKPSTRIRYTFIILKYIDNYNNTGQRKLVPGIFNIRQLEIKHLPILERINEIIKLEIPYKFGIISEDEYRKKIKYELFHSYYKYVNFFHITTEYLHTMKNFTYYNTNIKDCITLEEIIYSVSREKSKDENPVNTANAEHPVEPVEPVKAANAEHPVEPVKAANAVASQTQATAENAENAAHSISNNSKPIIKLDTPFFSKLRIDYKIKDYRINKALGSVVNISVKSEQLSGDSNSGGGSRKANKKTIKSNKIEYLGETRK